MWCGEVNLFPPVCLQSCDLVPELIVTWRWPIQQRVDLIGKNVNLTKEAGDIFHLYFQLLFFWEMEECFALINYVLDQCIIDARIFDIEEAHVKESITQRAEESCFSIGMP